jgi:DNA polymerase-3 subunit beta
MTATATKRRPKASSIEIPHSDLKDALHAVKAAVPTRSPKPILTNVLLADGVVSATDLELRIDYEIDAVTPAVLLPFGRLSAILGTAAGDAVDLTPGDTSCVVEIGSGRWTLPTEDAMEFPADAGGDQTPICRIPPDQFCRALAGTVFATDNESSRYALGAVLLEVVADEENPEEMKAIFVGTDGRRLARVEVEIDQAVDSSKTLIPARAAAAMMSLCKGREDAVQLERRGNDLVCNCGGVTITTRTTEGTFPRWRDVFPDRKVAATEVYAGALLAATKSAAIVTTEMSKGVTYAFTEQGLHLTARSSESGESSVTCGLVTFGQDAVTKLDPRYVAEWLGTIDPAATVRVEVVDGTSACVLKHEEASCVIMPLDPQA